MPKWPKLSETLPDQDPGHCGNCTYMPIAGERLTYWQECDDKDQTTLAYVVLCQACADRIIEPHPRLYRQLPANEIMPGAMAFCGDCVHRDGLACKCPAAKANGGEGIELKHSGQRAHICRSPRHISGWTWYGGEVVSCSGREPD